VAGGCVQVTQFGRRAGGVGIAGVPLAMLDPAFTTTGWPATLVQVSAIALLATFVVATWRLWVASAHRTRPRVARRRDRHPVIARHVRPKRWLVRGAASGVVPGLDAR